MCVFLYNFTSISYYQVSLERGTLIPEVNLDNIGIYSQLGRRQTNEDRYLVRELNHLRHLIFKIISLSDLLEWLYTECLF